MSSRSRVADNRAEANRATLKSLVKLEANKSCADCKRNKHPRWASWNLGVFVCIRCSGIHRSLGVHISKVKSVDLDSWTDEQTQSMLKWGNSRANKYWEAKLAPGHVPSESKIENFIRTKYDSKRWVMDGPMPDPSTLGDGDEDVPLAIVKEQVKIEQPSSQRGVIAPPRAGPATTRAPPVADLMGGDDIMSSAPSRPSTGPPAARAPPKAEAPPPKQTKPADSLLGLDFFGSAPAAPPARPSSTTGAAQAGNSRPDLKQSILSLYASAPKPAPAPQSAAAGFAGMQAAPTQSPQSQSAAFGDMNDAFGSLSFAPAAQQQPTRPSDPFAALSGPARGGAPSGHASKASYGGGGSFFSTPAAPSNAANRTTAQPPAPSRGFSSSSGFGDFLSSTSPVASPAAQQAPPQSHSGDLFDLGFGAPAAPAPSRNTQPSINSAFNLSSPIAPQQPQAQVVPQRANPVAPGNSTLDPWGSSNVWGSDSQAQAQAPAAPAASSAGYGWGAPSGNAGLTPSAPKSIAPQISADEDFGGWSSAATPQQPAPSSNNARPANNAGGGFGGASEDLFSNVWQ